MMQVTWIIDFEHDLTWVEAAENALRIQRDPNSIATIFTVTDTVTGKSVDVDLWREPDEKAARRTEDQKPFSVGERCADCPWAQSTITEPLP